VLLRALVPLPAHTLSPAQSLSICFPFVASSHHLPGCCGLPTFLRPPQSTRDLLTFLSSGPKLAPLTPPPFFFPFVARLRGGVLPPGIHLLFYHTPPCFFEPLLVCVRTVVPERLCFLVLPHSPHFCIIRFIVQSANRFFSRAACFLTVVGPGSSG